MGSIPTRPTLENTLSILRFGVLFQSYDNGGKILNRKSFIVQQGEKEIVRQRILSINGYVLVVVGFVFVVFGLLAYFAAIGPFKVLLHDTIPLAILPFTEAFALAALFGIILIRTSKQLHYDPFWNQLAFILHMIFGISNLVFWPFFASFEQLKITGVIATVLHFALASAELYAWILFTDKTKT